MSNGRRVTAHKDAQIDEAASLQPFREAVEETLCKLDSQPRRKRFHLVQLLDPLDTPLNVQIAAGITELPQQFEVQTSPEIPREKPTEISICRLKAEEWKGLRDKMDRDGYE